MFLSTVCKMMFRVRPKRDRWWKVQRLKELGRHFWHQTMRGRVGLCKTLIRRSYVFQTQARLARPHFRHKIRTSRLQGACNEFDMTAYQFKAGLIAGGVRLNTHMLNIMSIYEPRTFERLVELSQRSSIEKAYKDHMELPERCFTKVQDN